MSDLEWVRNIRNVTIWKNHSQMGEESILEYIFNNIGETNRFCVEFGAWDGFHLSNVRNLIEKGWDSLLMDGDNRGNEEVKCEIITTDNINDLFEEHDVPQGLDLLSIDVDGNDYWIWKELNYEPRVLLIEFNGTIGRGISKTIKYNPDHVWGENDYYGASFEALKKLGQEKGYCLVHQLGSTNLFFVRQDILGGYQDFEITYEPMQYHKHTEEGEWIEV